MFVNQVLAQGIISSCARKNKGKKEERRKKEGRKKEERKKKKERKKKHFGTRGNESSMCVCVKLEKSKYRAILY